ncbi:hypothetical protein [Aurantimonas sp. VKM B-3413]|uniref:hypothetical protein n=1 Tax=Aurantimonas sp. VKM B-3413 TaxID=2779401 RepID=UPI001E2AEEA5|nr:hypothetical protein [Aurantimonas sp. VKM B-3413]MCB8838864.1 hypothetical protein [Aurantimonas sp. VKM B-3413]
MMFDYSPKRLEDPQLVLDVVQALLDSGYDRTTIEEALIRQAPVDLDLLAECYEKLTNTLERVYELDMERAA